MSAQPLILGLAIGAGTGPELASVFRDAIETLARHYDRQVSVRTSARTYGTYHSMPVQHDAAAVAQAAEDDAAHYVDFCRDLVGAGAPALFRTAINAQSLYLARDRQQSVKVEHLPSPALDLLLVRDQFQGFYAGHNTRDADQAALHRSASFSRDGTWALLDFTLAEARQAWGVTAAPRLVMAYKFHLLDGLLARWVNEWSQARGLAVELVQPDTANRNLLAGHYCGRVAMLGSNEWSDVMHTVLLDRQGLGAQENRCTRNQFLLPSLRGLTEYQTVHGSADDIAGLDRVNPGATLRAAALMFQRHAEAADAVARMEAALATVHRRGLATRDQGGSAGTREVSRAVLAEFAAPRVAAPAPSAEALVLIDFQNDFCAEAARRGEDIAALASNVRRAVDHARSRGVPVLFVQFHGDAALQKPNWQARDRRLGKSPKCLRGSPGADFHGLTPQPGETVFAKPAAFDAFFAAGFAEHLRHAGLRHLVLAGLYADVCLDATARTAFQHGYGVTVLGDASASRHHRHADALRVLNAVCDARVLDTAVWIAERAG
jgi:nicotinamidase-related amidase/isocitrate/isopropylmalate dehydrogenase